MKSRKFSAIKKKEKANTRQFIAMVAERKIMSRKSVMPDMGPAPKMRWYERWIPIYMMHMQGTPMTWPTRVYMETMRAIHFLFFRSATQKEQTKFQRKLQDHVTTTIKHA